MAEKNEQLDLDFPNPEEFPSYDEVESVDGQAELPEGSFDQSGAGQHDDEGGCCVR